MRTNEVTAGSAAAYVARTFDEFDRVRPGWDIGLDPDDVIQGNHHCCLLAHFHKGEGLTYTQVRDRMREADPVLYDDRWFHERGLCYISEFDPRHLESFDGYEELTQAARALLRKRSAVREDAAIAA